MASAVVVLGSSSVWLGRAVAHEKLLHEGLLSGGRIQIMIEIGTGGSPHSRRPEWRVDTSDS